MAQASPGVDVGVLHLGAPFAVRLADLRPGSWARRLLSRGFGRSARGQLLGMCTRGGSEPARLWVCVRQYNCDILQVLAHECTHALLDGEETGEQCESRANVGEQVVSALVRAGALHFTLRDRELDAARRILLPAPEARPWELGGRVDPPEGSAPWTGGAR